MLAEHKPRSRCPLLKGHGRSFPRLCAKPHHVLNLGFLLELPLHHFTGQADKPLPEDPVNEYHS